MYKTGLVLSGGGLRGMAHIGALGALYEQNVIPAIISGVSAGAIVGVFLADGYQPAEILQKFNELKFLNYVKFSYPRQGIFEMEGIRHLLRNEISVKNLEDLKIPLVVCATNLTLGKPEYFREGPIEDIIVASASIPVVFKPVVLNGYTYVDGGVFDNLPVACIREECKKIIGIHVNPRHEENDFHNLIRIAERTFHLAVEANTLDSIKMCDIFVEPEALKDYSLLDASKNREVFEIGYHAMNGVLQKEPAGKGLFQTLLGKFSE